MKLLLIGLMTLGSISAFAGEQTKTKCSLIDDRGTDKIEKEIERLVEVNSKSGFNSLISHSVSITEHHVSGYSTLICVTSKL